MTSPPKTMKRALRANHQRVLLLGLLAMIGCSSSAVSPPPVADATPQPSADADAVQVPAESTVESKTHVGISEPAVMSLQEFTAEVASHRGKVVVVDLWALW